MVSISTDNNKMVELAFVLAEKADKLKWEKLGGGYQAFFAERHMVAMIGEHRLATGIEYMLTLLVGSLKSQLIVMPGQLGWEECRVVSDKAQEHVQDFVNTTLEYLRQL